MARQLILAADETVAGDELFFREAQDQGRFTSDGERATSATIPLLGLSARPFYRFGMPR
jgi:c-di-GMP-related signal transduction protein